MWVGGNVMKSVESECEVVHCVFLKESHLMIKFLHPPDFSFG